MLSLPARTWSLLVLVSIACPASALGAGCGSDMATTPDAAGDAQPSLDAAPADASAARDAALGPDGQPRDSSVADGSATDSSADTGGANPCVTATCATQLAVHNTHVCALRGDGQVVCWGDNAAGELGDGTTTDRSTPTVVLGLVGVARLGVNAGSFSCALMRDTTVKCWGANSDGQLGDGTTTARLVPTTVTGLTGVVGLDLGDYGGCARLSGGQVKCWGANNFGQLGTGQAGASELAPIDIPAFAGATQIQPAGLFTCAVFPSGAVKCVGYNGAGTLGDGTKTDRATPFTVAGVSDARALAVGWYHTCALRQGGAVTCWGDNGNGQLNDGTQTDRYVPGPVPNLTGVSAITAGAYTTCVLKAGVASCWLRGQTDVPIADPLAEVLPGNSSTCARTTLGHVYCWGDNQFGTLGDGTTTYRAKPGLVTGL